MERHGFDKDEEEQIQKNKDIIEPTLSKELMQ